MDNARRQRVAAGTSRVAMVCCNAGLNQGKLSKLGGAAYGTVARIRRKRALRA